MSTSATIKTPLLLSLATVALAARDSGNCAFQLDFESAVLTSERRMWQQSATHPEPQSHTVQHTAERANAAASTLARPTTTQATTSAASAPASTIPTRSGAPPPPNAS